MKITINKNGLFIKEGLIYNLNVGYSSNFKKPQRVKLVKIINKYWGEVTDVETNISFNISLSFLT